MDMFRWLRALVGRSRDTQHSDEEAEVQKILDVWEAEEPELESGVARVLANRQSDKLRAAAEAEERRKRDEDLPEKVRQANEVPWMIDPVTNPAHPLYSAYHPASDTSSPPAQTPDSGSYGGSSGSESGSSSGWSSGGDSGGAGGGGASGVD